MSDGTKATSVRELHPRKVLILDRLRRGDPVRQIAEDLRISTQAVYKHQRQLQEKGLLPLPEAG